MKQLIIDIPVQTKKTEVIHTKWSLYQEYEPATLSNGRWSHYGVRVMRTYKAVMLKLDIDVDKLTGTRTDYAGFKGAPSLVIRGKDVGEIFVEIREYQSEGLHAYRELSYGESQTETEKGLLKQQVYPDLISAIERNREGLYEEAKSKAIKATMRAMQGYKDKVIALEAEMQKMIDSVN